MLAAIEIADALNSKGLRPAASRIISSDDEIADALNSKGLRRRQLIEPICAHGNSRCPEFKGIKTPYRAGPAAEILEIANALNSKGLRLLQSVNLHRGVK